MATKKIAYFSMEIAIVDEIPTFSGGLGVLAGDFLRSAADLDVPLVAVSLLYRGGFFRQEIDDSGHQTEYRVQWTPSEHLERLEEKVSVTISGREVLVGVWRYVLMGVTGATLPIYLLDTALEENEPADRLITDRLYGGTPEVRLSQEAVLGLAGPKMLDALGHREISVFHMNEGHAALVPVALLSMRTEGRLGEATRSDVSSVRESCVFTTHTPVPAGHDSFDPALVKTILGEETEDGLDALGLLEGGWLNMTVLGMSLSGFINAVAQRHGEVSRAMFPQFRIESVTNGVHAGRWVAPDVARLFDRHLDGWRRDNTLLRYAGSIALEEVAAAHAASKAALLSEVSARTGVVFDGDALTIGVARRATAYKRNDLLLSDPSALVEIAARVGPIQVIYSGKSHPSDHEGKEIIARVNRIAKELKGSLRVVYLQDYAMGLASRLVSGVDVWLNTPVAPHEASGTSGMKAALNGVPSLSMLDGWWLEGHVEGVTGWSIGTDAGAEAAMSIDRDYADTVDAAELRRVLDEIVAPLYYDEPERFSAMRRSAISLNGSFFNTQRMADEYVSRAYQLDSRPHG